MKLNIFNAGLNVVPEPQYLDIADAVELTNTDVSKVSLHSIKDKVPSGITVKQNAIYFDQQNKWIDFDDPVDYVEYNNNLYITNGVGKPQRHDGTTSYNLGIAAPTSTIVASFKKAPSAPTDFKFKIVPKAAGVALDVTEAYYFAVTRAVDGGICSTGIVIHVTSDSVNTIATNVLKPTIYTTKAPKDDAGTLEVRLGDFGNDQTKTLTDVYRLYKGAWRYVSTTYAGYYIIDTVTDISSAAEWDPNSAADITGVVQYLYTYENSKTGAESGPSPLSNELDTTVDGAREVFLSNIEPPTDPQVDRINLYRVGNGYTEFMLVDTIKYSGQAMSGTWYDFGKPVSGEILTTQDIGLPPVGMIAITEAYAMLFGAKGSRLHFTIPGKPDLWPNLYFIDFAFEITMIAPVANGVLVSGKRKTCIILGTNPLAFSKQVLSNTQGCINRKSLQLVGKSAMWASLDGICQSAGGPVTVITRDKLGKLDLKPRQSALYNDIYYLLEEDKSLLIADYRRGVIFHRAFLGIEQILVADNKLYGWSNKELHELFKSDNLLEFRYVSPKFFEGQGTLVKQYKNMYILSEGVIIIEVYVDDVKVQTKELSGSGNHQLKLPQQLQKGNYCQLKITGTGVVREIFWVVNTGDAD